MTTFADRCVAWAKRFGLAAGERILGYPASWGHTKKEYDALTGAATQEK